MTQKSLVTILGSTGTIGVNTLDVMALHPNLFEVYALVAGRNIELLLKQVLKNKPQVIVICDENALYLWGKRGYSTQVLQQTGLNIPVRGLQGLDDACQNQDVEVVVAAIVGAAGLPPTLKALQAGKKVLLANKESLVLGGRFMLEACRQHGSLILPVDSEHNAIYQCLPADYNVSTPHVSGVERLILTASGGPFRITPVEQLKSITPNQAIAHPNWVMGKKISVDSATMANKSLELIEALWLFGLPAQQLSVLIHPQSIVHSMVEYLDGSVLAQLGCPDMRTPIAHVLGLPHRIASGSPKLDLAQIAKLEFEEPDHARFPMLTLAQEVLHKPDVLAPVFNAANEVAVDEFLNERLSFLGIYKLVHGCLEHFSTHRVQCLESAFELDQEVRAFAMQTASARTL
jgi:1-deoxy-D-xylulose-5-phosphate reductoisomerase